MRGCGRGPGLEALFPALAFLNEESLWKAKPDQQAGVASRTSASARYFSAVLIPPQDQRGVGLADGEGSHGNCRIGQVVDILD